VRVVVKSILFQSIDYVEQFFFGFDLFDANADFLIFSGCFLDFLDVLFIVSFLFLDLFVQLIN